MLIASHPAYCRCWLRLRRQKKTAGGIGGEGYKHPQGKQLRKQGQQHFISNAFAGWRQLPSRPGLSGRRGFHGSRHAETWRGRQCYRRHASVFDYARRIGAGRKTTRNVLVRLTRQVAVVPVGDGLLPGWWELRGGAAGGAAPVHGAAVPLPCLENGLCALLLERVLAHFRG